RREDNWIWSPPGIIDMHRPEKWGYVQFTGQPGDVSFVPDPAMPARNALHEIYYMQRAYQAKKHRWAAALDDLKLSADLGVGLLKPPTMKLTTDGFEASAEIKLPNGQTQCWHIRQDALIWPN